MNRVIPLLGNFNTAEQDQWLNHLRNHLPDEIILPFNTLSDNQKNTADVAIVANPRLSDIEQLPSLTWVHSLWAGVEKLIAKLGETPIRVVRLQDPALADSMSEAVLAWVLYLHRHMPHYQAQQIKHDWQPLVYVPARERRIGILGLGALGRAAAERLAANQFKVSGWSRSEKQLAGIRCFSTEQGLTEMLNQSDIVVCLLPHTPATVGLINSSRLSALKTGASLINFARGPIIDDAALLSALTTGQVSHAVLDVFSQEPLPVDHEFWDHPGITILPHISAPTLPASASQVVAQHIIDYRRTGTIPNSVDPITGY